MSDAHLPENELIGNILHDAEEYNGASQALSAFGVQQINGPVILDRSLSSASPDITLQERGLPPADDASGQGCFLNPPLYYALKQYGEGGQLSSMHPLDMSNQSLFYSLDLEGLGWGGVQEDGYVMMDQRPYSFNRSFAVGERAKPGYGEAKAPVEDYVAPVSLQHGVSRGGGGQATSAREATELSSYIQSINLDYSGCLFQGSLPPGRAPAPLQYDKYAAAAGYGGAEGKERENRGSPSAYGAASYQHGCCPVKRSAQPAEADAVHGALRAPPSGDLMSFRNFNSLSAPSQYGYYAILDGQSSFAPHPPNYHPMLQPAAQLDASEASPIGCAGPSVGGGGNKDSEPFRAPQYNNSYNSPLKTTSGYLHEPPLLYLLSNPGQPCLLPGDARLPQEYRPAPPRTSSDDSLYPQMVASYGLPPSKPPCYKGGEHASPSKGGGPAASRSSLLEEFRNIKGNRKFELKDAVDHFVEFSSDQYGSRFIQQKLEVATNEEKQMVFQEIFPVALQLMTDVFGNYVIQKFFEYGTNEQKKSLGDALEGNVLSLSLQMYGCRVVQKAFEVISVEQQAKLVRELNGFVLKCIKDQNGNHVIQKVIEQVPPNLILFVVDTFKGKVCSLAMHPYGCRVIQRILEHCSLSNASSCKGASAQLDILDELLKETPKLVQDQYGNYVVQHVLENGRQKDRRAIISHLEGKIVALSQHKFASNVIEKCVQYGSYDDRQMILQEIVSEKPVQNGNYLPLEIMMKDAYANYVVQKILEVCDNSQRNLLVLKIKPHLASLKKYTYAKHIIARLEKILGKPL